MGHAWRTGDQAIPENVFPGPARPPPQYVVQPFVDHAEAQALKARLSGIQASGGGDEAEDVAGALQVPTACLFRWGQHLQWRGLGTGGPMPLGTPHMNMGMRCRGGRAPI